MICHRFGIIFYLLLIKQRWFKRPRLNRLIASRQSEDAWTSMGKKTTD